MCSLAGSVAIGAEDVFEREAVEPMMAAFRLLHTDHRTSSNRSIYSADFPAASVHLVSSCCVVAGRNNPGAFVSRLCLHNMNSTIKDVTFFEKTEITDYKHV